MTAMTKSERLARRRVIYHLWLASEDDIPLDEVRAEVPDAWHLIEADLDCTGPKKKVTLYLDASVARAFQAMGTGYQGRINRILETWLQMKMAGFLKAEAMVMMDRRKALLAEEKETGVRPGWGQGV